MFNYFTYPSKYLTTYCFLLSLLLADFCFLARVAPIIADLEHPENNGGELYVVDAPDETTPNGEEQIDLMKIAMVIPDLQDYKDKKLTGHVILGGRAFLVSLPSVPAWMVNKMDALLGKERGYNKIDGFDQGMKKMTAMMGSEHEAKTRKVRHILLVFPEDVVISANMKDHAPPADTCAIHKAGLRIRSINPTTVEGVKIQDDDRAKVQNHYIGHWILRVVSRKQTWLVAQRPVRSVDEDDDLAQSFGGMGF
jgi:hypothetical protein